MSRLSAVVLAMGGASALGDSTGGPACLVEFGRQRPYLWWLCRYLDAWGIGARSIVVNEAHRDWFDDHDPSSGQLVFMPDSAVDPLADLLEALPGVELDATVLLISGNALPPPFDPHDLLIPEDSEAVACIAVGPLSPDWRLGFAVTGRNGDPAGVVFEVVEDASHAYSADHRFMSSFGMTAVTVEALWNACHGASAPRRMGDLLSQWASDGVLLARCYDLPQVRFTNAVELAVARAEFRDWRADLVERMDRAGTDVVDGHGDV